VENSKHIIYIIKPCDHVMVIMSSKLADEFHHLIMQGWTLTKLFILLNCKKYVCVHYHSQVKHYSLTILYIFKLFKSYLRLTSNGAQH